MYIHSEIKVTFVALESMMMYLKKTRKKKRKEKETKYAHNVEN